MSGLNENTERFPEESVISLSRSHPYFLILGNLLCIVWLISVIGDIDPVVWIIIVGIIILILAYCLYLNLTSIITYNKQDAIRLILNDKGIYINEKFILWHNVLKYEFISKPKNDGTNLTSNWYLVVYTKRSTEEIYIRELDTNEQKLTYLINLYLIRNQINRL
jgi:hypothetical protein